MEYDEYDSEYVTLTSGHLKGAYGTPSHFYYVNVKSNKFHPVSTSRLIPLSGLNKQKVRIVFYKVVRQILTIFYINGCTGSVVVTNAIGVPERFTIFSEGG